MKIVHVKIAAIKYNSKWVVLIIKNKNCSPQVQTRQHCHQKPFAILMIGAIFLVEIVWTQKEKKHTHMVKPIHFSFHSDYQISNRNCTKVTISLFIRWLIMAVVWMVNFVKDYF